MIVKSTDMAIVGQATGAVMGGIAIDKWIAWRAHRNNGVFQPETRLSLIFIPSSLIFLGIVLFGFAVQQQMHWAVIFLAYGFVSIGLTGSASIAMTYVCDTYFPVAAECLETINGLKNVVAFGFIHATVPWVESEGYEKVSIGPKINRVYTYHNLPRHLERFLVFSAQSQSSLYHS